MSSETFFFFLSASQICVTFSGNIDPTAAGVMVELLDEMLPFRNLETPTIHFFLSSLEKQMNLPLVIRDFVCGGFLF